MNRRSILKSLGILPLGLLTPKVIVNKEQLSELRIGDTIYTCENYKGFKYFWTDWKQQVDSLRITSQWIAINTKVGVNIYSSYPGKSGQFVKGAFFNTTPTFPQHYMEITCKQEVKETAKEAARLVLLKEIDKYYVDLHNIIEEPRHRFGFSGFIPAKNAYIYNIK